MSSTTSLQLPLLVAEQAQKSVTHNEALKQLDALVRTRVEEQGLTTPPGSPSDGTIYIPGSGATGAWSAWDFNLAYYVDGAWQKIVPKVGWVVYDINEAGFYEYVGAPDYWTRHRPSGAAEARQWTFDTNTSDSDPGSGDVKLDNSDLSLATKIWIDDNDNDGNDATAWLDSLDEPTSRNHKGYLTLRSVTDASIYAEFVVCGDVVDKTGYREIPVSLVVSAGTLSGSLAVEFSRAGEDEVKANVVLRNHVTGASWLSSTSAADNIWESVAWSPELGLFVAVGQSGTGNRVMTSPDGITWTARTSAADNNWFGVTWSPELGLFCAVAASGTGNRVMTSPDGITWTARTSAADNGWIDVAWSPELGLFCAVAQSGDGQIG